MARINAEHQRVTNITGKRASLKKDGYAAGPVPESMQPTKAGKTDFVEYNGPNVAKGSWK